MAGYCQVSKSSIMKIEIGKITIKTLKNRFIGVKDLKSNTGRNVFLVCWNPLEKLYMANNEKMKVPIVNHLFTYARSKKEMSLNIKNTKA